MLGGRLPRARHPAVGHHDAIVPQVSILLRIAYDGTGFSGWARQKDRLDGTPIRTVQAEIEAGLSRLYGVPVLCRGASRTDAGVHARGQLATFEPPSDIPPSGVVRALAGRLPRDVTVIAAWEEPLADVRGGNDGKHYRYRIRTTHARDPVGGRDEWHAGRPMDVRAMADAGLAFIGEHDFSGFRTANCQAHTTVRTITALTVRGHPGPLGPVDPGHLDEDRPDLGGDLVVIDVEGTAFLHNMVRIMVGTLGDIGLGRRGADSIPRALASGARDDAGPTAPACGLTLVEVKWPSPAPDDKS